MAERESQHGDRRDLSASRRDARFPEELDGRRYDDEISLVDLGLVLLRRRWWVVGIAAIVAAAGLAVGIAAQEAEHGYVTTFSMAAESDRALMNRSAARALLTAEIVPAVRRETRNREEAEAPEVEVELVANTALIELTSVAPPDGREAVAELHRRIHRRYRAAEEPLVERRLEALERAVAEHDEDHQARLARHDHRVTAAERRLALRQERLEELRDEGELLRSARPVIAAGGAGAEGGLELLRENLAARANMRGRIRNARDQLAELERESRRLERSYQRRDRDLREAFDEVDGGALVAVAVETDSQEGTRGGLIGALSLVLGGMLGLFGAFLREFVDRIREQMV